MDVAQDIKKQYGKIYFSNPAISFAYNQIVIRTRLSTFDYINILAAFLVQVVLLLINPFDSLWWNLLLFISSLLIVHTITSGANKVKIDFFYRKVEVIHQFLLFNKIRKVLKIPTKFFFSQVDHMYNKEGFYFARTTRNFLLIKLFDHSPLKLAHFKFAGDSEKLAEILNSYLCANSN
jgi:hypothetical protein